jgi:6-phosphogluconolactonase
MSRNTNYTRREFLSTAVAGSTALLLTRGVSATPSPWQREMRIYVGTYTSNSKSEGIYVCKFDLETGKITIISTATDVPDPSFLTLDRSGEHLYAVNELLEFEGKSSGSVSSFAVDPKTGSLKFVNKQPSMGGAPCHISIAENGKFILVANYLGGNVSVFQIGSDGRIGPSTDLAQHTGFGPNKDRQLSAHAHSITLDNNGRFAIAADLGIDRVMIYAFDRGLGRLKPNLAQPFFQAKPGAGPRHFAFHPKGKLAFVINELSSSVTSLSYDGKAGTLKEIETLSTLSPGFSGQNTCADLHVSPDGKFLYGSNRGSDSIAVFSIDEDSGKLTFIENTPSGGKKPRNFAIDPTGNFLLAANQETGNIVVFRIDKRTGKLLNTGQAIDIPAPVCIKFFAGAM